MKKKFEKLAVESVSRVIKGRQLLSEAYASDELKLVEKGLLELQFETLESTTFSLLVDMAKIVYDIDAEKAAEKIVDIETKLYDKIEKVNEEKEKGKDD